MSFLNRFRKQPVVEPDPAPPPASVPVSRAKGFVPPPPRESIAPNADPRVDRLRQRVKSLEEEIEATERSGDPDSPFQQRIFILTAALDDIEQEIAHESNLASRDVPPLPPTPIEHVTVQLDPVPIVSFSIGGRAFRYEEEVDWAERGTQIVHGDLVGIDIKTNGLIPSSMSPGETAELASHLDRSLFAFATDLRDRAIEGQPLPTNATLTDLAIPSAQCGDWLIWGGVSLRCLEHETRLRELNSVRTRLIDERSTVIEERQRQVEELPIQRRRLDQAITELRTLEAAS